MNIKCAITTAFILCVLAVGGPDPRASDSGVPNWLLTLTASPPSRTEHALVYDSRRDRLVMFGGFNRSEYPFRHHADTWEWDGSRWNDRTPPTSPPARFWHAMAYDSARGRVVLFGGYHHDSAFPYLGDTWEWDGNTWMQRTPATSPPPRANHAMAYDSERGRVVMFGGASYSSGPQTLGDTWEWDGNNWVLRTPATSPAARTGHAMTYDSARARIVLFGGSSLGDTWEWDGNNWVQRTPAASPPRRSDHAMAYDGARGRVVMFGGNGSTLFDDTWEWDGSSWLECTPQMSPKSSYGHQMAYDSARGRVVMFGGLGIQNWNPSNDTWEWDGAAWFESRPTGWKMAYDSTRGRLVQFGGYRSYADDYTGDTWEWAGAWVERHPSTSPPARDGHAMAYDGVRERVVLFGGYSYSSGLLGDTWEWDGSAWIDRTPGGVQPSVRVSHSMVYDSARERVVLFGGYGSNDEDLGDTWEWDGSNWNHRSPATSPPARYGHAMGYDSARGRVVLFGGYSLSLGLLGDTWEWDGSMWIERTPGENPPARYEPAMTYDSGRGRVVLFGGDASISEAQEYLGDTWEWDGSAWVERLPSTGPTVRLGHTMAYDEARGRLVLFGGSSADYEALDDMWEYGPIDSCGHASNVVAFTPGNGTDDNSALATLGAPDSLTVSLGLGGSVELQIDPPVPNGPGADLMVHEIGSFHGGLDDSFRVEVSEDGTVYRSAGDCAGDDCQLDLGGSGLSSARYVRLVDLVPDDGEPAPEAGADIDAVSVVACADCAAEVKGVAAEALGADGLRLSWNAAAGAATYAIIRGQLSTLSATLGDCVAGGLGALMWDDAELPPPGDGFTYLVRGESSVCGPGPLGFGAGGAPRVYTGGACP